MTELITAAGSDSMTVQRTARQIAAVVQRLRRGHANARNDFRDKPLSRRKRVQERRRGLRMPLHVPVYLQPCTVSGNRVRPVGERVIGVTRDVSEQGIGLSYDTPIKAPYVLAEFDIYGRGVVTMLVELRWTLVKGPHAYMAGGEWVGVVKEDR